MKPWKHFNCYKIDKCCWLSLLLSLALYSGKGRMLQKGCDIQSHNQQPVYCEEGLVLINTFKIIFFIHLFVFRETVLEGRPMSSRKWVPLRTEWMLWPRDWNKLASSLSAFQQNAQRMGRTGTEYNPVETVYCKQDSWLDIVKTVSFPEKMLIVPFLFTYFSELFAVIDCVSCKFYSFI